MDALVKDVMTPRSRLITALEGTDFEQVMALLHNHKIEKVLLVSEADELTGMITVKDIVKAQAYPMACKDVQGQLRVGASVGTSAETQLEWRHWWKPVQMWWWSIPLTVTVKAYWIRLLGSSGSILT